MRPPMRADKLLEAARLATETGLVELRKLAKEGGPAARKVLKRFPGIGEPGADRLLLAAGSAVTLAPESNGLRVLVRIGFATEDAGTTPGRTGPPPRPSRRSCRTTADGWSRRISSCRRHGQETCRRSEPRCDVCPLAKGCDFARSS